MQLVINSKLVSYASHISTDGQNFFSNEFDDQVLRTHPVPKKCNTPPEDNATSTTLQLLYSNFKNIVNSIPNKQKWLNLSSEERRIIKNLKEKDLCILPSDKGREFCIIDRATYNQLAENHLADQSVYKVTRNIQSSTIESRINNVWKSVCMQNSIPNRIHKSYRAANSIMPSFYHLIKTHKAGNTLKIRPIVSSIDGPTWRLCYFINIYLKPLLNSVPAHLENSQILLDSIKNLSIETRQNYNYPFSLDVVSLYTSIPINDALSAIESFIRNNSNSYHSTSIPPCDLLRLIKVVLENSFFTFSSKLYHQHSGLPMGCNISPAVAIIFMHQIETRALNIFNRTAIFKRYVDDIFILVKNQTEANTLFNIVNNIHPKIKFEIEHPQIKSTIKCLSLLDFTIKMSSDGSLSYFYYQKKAKRDLFIHKNSHLPSHVKENIIKNEFTRRTSKCSSDSIKHEVKNNFSLHLSKRGYSSEFIQRAANRPNRHKNQTKPFYLDIPYISDAIDNKIKSIFRRRGINIRISRNSYKLFNFLRPKRESLLVCSNPTCHTQNENTCFKKNVVYQLSCETCPKTYIGHTQRFLHTRIHEHTLGQQSKAYPHFSTCSGNRFRVGVLSKQKDCVNAKISESLFIREKSPALNNREEMLSLF